jgi:hypothetical protein
MSVNRNVLRIFAGAILLLSALVAVGATTSYGAQALARRGAINNVSVVASWIVIAFGGSAGLELLFKGMRGLLKGPTERASRREILRAAAVVGVFASLAVVLAVVRGAAIK